MDCPRCGSKNHNKNGFTKGKQRYLCKDCKYNYTIPEMWAYSDAEKKEALRYHNERIPFRTIERLLHISHNSVIRWVKEAAKQIKEIVHQPQKEEKCDVLELDEMWHFVKKN
jgi:transposase-like protein